MSPSTVSTSRAQAPSESTRAAGRSPVWRLGEGRRRVLVIDNYDSFTFNLVQALVVLDATVEVVRNDSLVLGELLGRQPDAVVLSPGPGRPESSGLCVELLAQRPRLPVLGVCLGHQALGCSFGATVERAPVQVHGKTSQIEYRPHALFAGLPNPFEATRYHSLHVVERTLPQELVALAWSEDGVVMAMTHRELPYFGVQFHPESVLTVEGPKLLENFLALAEGPRR
ncbi:MAG TPA: aminodeoxychorismate/anthranilate synthase component II [Thermoanaerobaculia bacterium]|nr:aminodeoxychorismate/anthranilate synthase component II [Thermoanaerobaculia bacterium]